MGLCQYTGQVRISGTGLYHYKARAYHPGLGRFLQPDPSGMADGPNLYAYVGNDPINLVDPLGLQAVLPEISVTGLRDYRPGDWFEHWWFSGRIDGDQGNIPREQETIEEIVVTGEKDKKEKSLFDKAKRCTSEQLGLDDLAAIEAIVAGQPIPGSKRFTLPGSSKGTSVAAMAADEIFGKARFSKPMPTIVGGPGTGRVMAIAYTKSVARFAGRAVPIVGWAILAYDVGSIAVCVAGD